MMDGRLKTLHPKVHGGLLAVRDDPAHTAAANTHGIAPIDLLVVNLYPFEATVAKGAPFADCIENIDIGGPAMIRAAAKNHAGVTVVVDPDDYYGRCSTRCSDSGATNHRAAQDAAARPSRARRLTMRPSGWFADALGEHAPVWRSVSGRLRRSCATARTRITRGILQDGRAARRRGDGAVRTPGQGAVLQQLNDTDAAVRAGGRIRSRSLSSGRHHQACQPCGVALGRTLAEAYAKALRCDPVSAFGGIIALNGPIDGRHGSRNYRIFTRW